VGDRVAGTSHDACGVCQKCVEGRYNLCENYGKPGLHRQYGHNTQGADATYVVQGVKTIFRLPDGLSFEDGALIDPASIALHTASRGGVAPGDTVAITGPGPVGLLAGDAALVRGAARVIVIGRGERLAKAAALGFETVDHGAGDPVAAVRAMTGGLGADVALECAGVPEAVQWCLALLRRGGRCAAVGIPVQGVEILMQRLVLDELELVGVRASAGEMRRVMPLVEQGRIRVREMVTHRFPLDRYAEALATFRDRSSGALKILVMP
jgi:L-iditol 2-dehydrogenase